MAAPKETGSVAIRGKTYVEGFGWNIDCVVVFQGTRSGTEYVDLPDTATDAEIEEYILRAYGQKD